MIINTDHTKKPGMSSGALKGYAVPASYKTPIVLTYMQSIPVKLLPVIEERTKLRNRK